MNNPDGTNPGAPHGAPYQAPYNPYAMSGPVIDPVKDRNAAVWVHLSAFAAAWAFVAPLGPLLLMLFLPKSYPFARRQAVEALNFNLTWFVILGINGLLMFVLIGFITLPIFGLIYFILVVLAAVAASKGQEYRYPMTIRLISPEN